MNNEDVIGFVPTAQRETLSLLRKLICSTFELEPTPTGKVFVHSPFMFDDGDGYVVSVSPLGPDAWVVSDEGHTLMHLEYSGLDLLAGTRAQIIEESILRFGVHQEGVALTATADSQRLGDAILSFIQCLTQVASVTHVAREHTKSKFKRDLRELILSAIPTSLVVENWHDPAYDTKKNYPADYRVETACEPWMIFGVHNDDKCRRATISLLNYEKWSIPHKGIAIYENQARIHRGAVSQLSDVTEKQFSSLDNRDRIAEYLRSVTRPAG